MLEAILARLRERIFATTSQTLGGQSGPATAALVIATIRGLLLDLLATGD